MPDRAPAVSDSTNRCGAKGPVAPRHGAWRFHILAEIANFAALRRHLGCARVETLALDVVARLTPHLPDCRIAVVGRTTIEIAGSGNSRTCTDASIQRLGSLASMSVDLAGETHEVALRFGAATAPSHSADDLALVEEAEHALIAARATGTAITPGIPPASAREMDALACELSDAVDRDELLMLYQPKVHVRRQEITSAEALVRWRHPRRGMVLPNDFIPAAEQANIIDRMTLWTIARVIADQQRLRDAGHDLRIFINISGQLLSDDAFVDAACTLVANSDATLGFEVTETSVINDPTIAIANLQRFADHGVTIAIDDYGAGLSSLAYLKQLPARELKIDRLFITQLTSSNRDPLIVRSTIDLAHALEMEVVAEGVETHAALALLTVMGCDMVQGYLISRPITLEALIAFVGEGRHQCELGDNRAPFSALTLLRKRG